uniref:Uncharacterized protein n=1 Tax=Cacopsylla melanoneura TaxID=428564 RepID=A0A8D8VAD9_9HEMI
MKPTFKLDNVNTQFKEEDQKTSDSGNNELISETLIIVQEFNEDANVNTRHVSDRFTTYMSRVLASNSWWLTHVCVANDDKFSNPFKPGLDFEVGFQIEFFFLAYFASYFFKFVGQIKPRLDYFRYY